MKIKLKSYLILSLTVTMLAGTIADCHSSHSSSLFGDCCGPRIIRDKDINCRKGFVIDTPGVYTLCEDIVFRPRLLNVKDAAITINSSDVVLDLGGHTISQGLPKNVNIKPNTPPALISGIVADDVDSISIVNGSITDFKDAGIRIENSNNIIIEEINILRTGVQNSFGGLQISESSDILIEKVRCLYNFGSGMSLHGVVKTTVANSHFDDNFGGNVASQIFFGPGIVGAGAFVDSSSKTVSSMILFQDCSFNRNSGSGQGSGLEIGTLTYTFLPVRNVTLLRCEFQDNIMGGVDTTFNDASGLVLLAVDNFLIQDCVASGQRHPSLSGPNPAVSGAVGFSINVSDSGVIENCQANDNVGQGNSSVGMRIRGCQDITILNCECSRNLNTGSGQAYGYDTDNDNFVPTFPPIGNAYIFESCVAQQNQSATGISGGFKIANLARSTIANCISQENGTGILVTDSNAPTQALDNIFKHNIVQNNAVAGIEDQVASSNNAYFENIARSNGPGGVTNYVGLPGGSPIVTWSITGGFPATPNPFANLDIIP